MKVTLKEAKNRFENHTKNILLKPCVPEWKVVNGNPICKINNGDNVILFERDGNNIKGVWLGIGDLFDLIVP